MSINSMLAIIFLVICAVYDLKTKTIPVWLLILFALSGFIPTIRNLEEPFWLAFLPGAVLLAIGYCTKESIGFGDGVIVLILGLFTGYRLCLSSVIAGFVLTAVFSAALLICKKANRKSRVPYIPFLTAGFGVMSWI